MSRERQTLESVRVIAFYLPQFHPIPENDSWWGKGFTEWTNVTKAKPLFPGHHQPVLPAELGYYDLRVPETRLAQAEMARANGITGFCYWHYWFGNGRQLLERPFSEVLESGKPDFPFCLAWANESWKGFPHGLKNRNTLIEQEYPGREDFVAHFMSVLPAFKDPRYLTRDRMPIFMIYRPLASPAVRDFIVTWRILAKEHGLDGIHFIGHLNDPAVSVEAILATGVDAVNTVRLTDFFFREKKLKKMIRISKKNVLGFPHVVKYADAASAFLDPVIDARQDVYPSLIPNWDHTPRSGRDGLVFQGSSPELFGKHVRNGLEMAAKKRPENRFLFVKSWNEWAEGNYMEPDSRFGLDYLSVLKRERERT